MRLPRVRAACLVLLGQARLYIDRGSHYFYTPNAGEPVDRKRMTQVGRVLRRNAIKHIPAYWPESHISIPKRPNRSTSCVWMYIPRRLYSNFRGSVQKPRIDGPGSTGTIP